MSATTEPASFVLSGPEATLVLARDADVYTFDLTYFDPRRVVACQVRTDQLRLVLDKLDADHETRQAATEDG